MRLALSGELVPDDLVVKVVEERFQNPVEVENGFVLDGFPRAISTLVLRFRHPEVPGHGEFESRAGRASYWIAMAVIGGGPAGSFFSYFVLTTAERLGLELEFMSYPQHTEPGRAMREWIVETIRPVTRQASFRSGSSLSLSNWRVFWTISRPFCSSVLTR